MERARRFQRPVNETRVMSRYCIVKPPGVPVREIAALGAADDASARLELDRLAERWPGFETNALYEGERSVCGLANPALDFTATPLEIQDQAA